ncbi:MAG: hypothetical protein PWQ57_882 [Desulfovibrionales bacterium]|jgi:hypothetical protein|nr:hypothetical protein [Desulfovibrionales bacterium]
MSDQTTIHEGYMEDSQGRLVPVNLVPELDQLKDTLVKELVSQAKTAQSALKEHKLNLLGELHAFQALAHEKYGAKLGGAKGNLSLTSYDGRVRVQVAIGESVAIDDEKLQAAKALIDECLKEWTSESGPELRALVHDAFRVDSEGRVSTRSILGLLRLEITDERWQRAMQAIRDGLRVDSSKSYVRFHQRTGPESKWEQISLEFAAL